MLRAAGCLQARIRSKQMHCHCRSFTTARAKSGQKIPVAIVYFSIQVGADAAFGGSDWLEIDFKNRGLRWEGPELRQRQ